MNLNTKDYILLACLGVVSGGLSFYGFNLMDFAMGAFGIAASWLPGVIFGIFFSIYILINKKSIKKWKIIIFIIGSTISSWAAHSIVIALGINEVIESFYLLIFLGGLVGSFLLVTSTRLSIARLHIKEFIFGIVVGTILGFSYFINIDSFIEPVSRNMIDSPWHIVLNSPDNVGPIQLYIIWQVGMMITLGCFVKKGDKPINDIPQ